MIYKCLCTHFGINCPMLTRSAFHWLDPLLVDSSDSRSWNLLAFSVLVSPISRHLTVLKHVYRGCGPPNSCTLTF